MAGAGSPSKRTRPYGSSSTIVMPARRQISAMRGRRGRECDAGGVVEVRDRVEQLDRAARSAHLVDAPLERRGDQPVFVALDVLELSLQAHERADRADIGRGLGEHDVSRIAEHCGDEFESELRARGDEHVVGVGLDAEVAHELRHLLAQGEQAGARAVLEHLGAMLADEPRGRFTELGLRQRREVGVAAGERDDAGLH